jgi:repressor LexA
VGLSSRSHVNYYLAVLQADGLVERRPRTPRGLRLLGIRPGPFDVKLEGTIAAGFPIELAQGLARDIQLTPDIADPRRDLFALQVRGDSMVADLVGDGDIVVVERSRDAEPGQMAVVYLRDRNEATLKHVFPEGERVRLQPAHPTMPAFYADARSVEVQGRVVAIIRQL